MKGRSFALYSFCHRLSLQVRTCLLSSTFAKCITNIPSRWGLFGGRTVAVRARSLLLISSTCVKNSLLEILEWAVNKNIMTLPWKCVDVTPVLSYAQHFHWPAFRFQPAVLLELHSRLNSTPLSWRCPENWKPFRARSKHRPTQSVVYVLLQVNRFLKSILLIGQCRYLNHRRNVTNVTNKKPLFRHFASIYVLKIRLAVVWLDKSIIKYNLDTLALATSVF